MVPQSTGFLDKTTAPSAISEGMQALGMSWRDVKMHIYDHRCLLRRQGDKLTLELHPCVPSEAETSQYLAQPSQGLVTTPLRFLRNLIIVDDLATKVLMSGPPSAIGSPRPSPRVVAPHR